MQRTRQPGASAFEFSGDLRLNRSIPSVFYEIGRTDNSVPKRNGGFATVDAAKVAAGKDAKKMKAALESNRPEVGRTLVGQNAEKPTRLRAFAL